jgi:hypothetical protein
MKCKTCGKNANSEYCFKCKPRKPLSSGKGLSSKMSVISSIKAKNVHNDGHNQQKDMFLDIWKKRPHYSEVSGKFLGDEPKSTYFHHVLPKSKYPEFSFDQDNIILLTFAEHQMVETDIYKYDEVNRRRETLKTKYNLL